VGPTNALPIFGVYTTPTGVDDYAPGLFKSRLMYEMQDNKLYSGELVVLYNNVSILEKNKNIHPKKKLDLNGR